MTFYNTAPHFVRRRRLLKGAAALGLGGGLLPLSTVAQTSSPLLKPATPEAVQAVIDAFLQGAEAIPQGLKLDMPVLGDNPAAVPLKVIFETNEPTVYCEELIVLAESNPHPLACRFKFTPLAGTTEVAMRLRLIESQTVRVLARMSDQSYLSAHHAITVTAGGCGM